jgi:DNA polymerase III epsilon subunit-like protein
MKLLFIDTETNGLPISRFAPYTSTGNWPEIVQISWQVVDSVSWETIDEYDAFLKPYGIWSKEAERVHQIPESIVTNFGKNKTDVFTSLKSAIDVCDYIIAHNMTFDKTVILCEIQRLWESGDMSLKPSNFWKKGVRDICTMVSTKDLCAIKFSDNNKFKYPKLNELYAKLFSKAYDISGAKLHNSKNDVGCLIMCFKELVNMPQFSTLFTWANENA